MGYMNIDFTLLFSVRLHKKEAFYLTQLNHEYFSGDSGSRELLRNCEPISDAHWKWLIIEFHHARQR